jgi:hypothetical protein
MFGWRKKEAKALIPNRDVSEDVRHERGKLAEAVVELDRERFRLEQLMLAMLEETRKGRRHV